MTDTDDDPILRPLRRGDTADVFAAFASHPDMQRQAEVGSLEEAERYVDSLVSERTPHRPWVLEHGGAVIGLVCVTVDAKNRNGWFWYWMHAAFRGRGWMARAAATVAEQMLAEGGIERLELGHRANNPASGAIARAAGFVPEGVEREKFLIDGARIDVLTYGRLRSDPHPSFAPVPMRSPADDGPR